MCRKISIFPRLWRTCNLVTHVYYASVLCYDHRTGSLLSVCCATTPVACCDTPALATAEGGSCVFEPIVYLLYVRVCGVCLRACSETFAGERCWMRAPHKCICEKINEHLVDVRRRGVKPSWSTLRGCFSLSKHPCGCLLGS